MAPVLVVPGWHRWVAEGGTRGKLAKWQNAPVTLPQLTSAQDLAATLPFGHGKSDWRIGQMVRCPEGRLGGDVSGTQRDKLAQRPFPQHGSALAENRPVGHNTPLPERAFDANAEGGPGPVAHWQHALKFALSATRQRVLHFANRRATGVLVGNMAKCPRIGLWHRTPFRQGGVPDGRVFCQSPLSGNVHLVQRQPKELGCC